MALVWPLVNNFIQMGKYGIIFRLLLLIAAFNLFTSSLKAGNDDLRFWTNQLKDSSKGYESNYLKVRGAFIAMDSATWYRNISSLEEMARQENKPRLNCRILRLKTDITLTSFGKSFSFEPEIPKAKAGLNYAISINDSDLIFESYNTLAGVLIGAGHEKMAMIYLIREDKLFGHKGLHSYDYPINSISLRLSGLAYHTGNFVESIKYARKALSLPDQSSNLIVGAINTIGVCFRELRNFDSAQFYLTKALKYALKEKDSIYYNIALGNIAFNYFYNGNYDTAEKILHKYIKFSTSLKWFAEVSKIECTLGNIALKEKNINEAEMYFSSAEKNFKLEKDKSQLNIQTLVSIYTGLTEINRIRKNLSNELKYTQLLYKATDSANTYKYETDLQSLRLNEELVRQEEQIEEYQEEKYNALHERILYISFSSLFVIIGFLVLRNRRNKYQFSQKILREEKERAQSELQTAKLELEKFTGTFIKQNELIEDLSKRLNELNTDRKTEGTLDEIEKLQEIKILTDEDWQHFKNLYNRAYPSFFTRLAERFPHLTPAESRYASLMKLGLDNKQMSHILAVSTDSMRKLKFRFREKTNIPETHDEDIRRIINEI